MRQVVVAIMLAAGPFVVGASLILADGVGDPTAVKHDDGRYYDKEGNPTFKVQSDSRNHRAKTPPASAGNRSLNLQTR